jgi:hypothetical protein
MSQKMKKHSESVVPQDDEKIIPFVNNKSVGSPKVRPL